MDYVLDKEARGRWIVVRFRGPVTLEGLRDLAADLREQSLFAPDQPRLFDWNAAMLADLEPTDAVPLLLDTQPGAAGGPEPHGIIAHVCADPLKRILLKYWVAAAGSRYGLDTELFLSLDQAHAWLELRTSQLSRSA